MSYQVSFKLFILFSCDKILHAKKAQKEYKTPKVPKSTKKYKNTTKQKSKTQISEQK